jgi:MFS family permease
MNQYGQRLSVCGGLIFFALGNLFCGAATDLSGLVLAKLVEGVGKGMVIVICRSMLYRQFDRDLLVAIGFYGVIAYATRPTTPLFTAYVNDLLSWRWIFWVNVPVAIIALPLVWRYIRPDRPASPHPQSMNWAAATLLSVWVTCMILTFGWYRKWGGFTSNAFTVTAILSAGLPVLLLVALNAKQSGNERLERILRVQPYLVAMGTRALLLVNLLAVEIILAEYMIALRDYPRTVAGWVLAPATLAMATSTLLTIRFQHRKLRQVWLLVGACGAAACLWWISAIDNFTPKEHITLVHALWGLCIGLLPPVFLTDEVEALEPRDAAFGGGLAVLCLLLTLITVPVMTSTSISAWSDRAADSERLNISSDRVAVQQAQAAIADALRQRGLSGPELAAQTGRILGGYVKVESVARGLQYGLKFLSLMMLGIGLLLALLRWTWPPKQRVIADCQPPAWFRRPDLLHLADRGSRGIPGTGVQASES